MVGNNKRVFFPSSEGKCWCHNMGQGSQEERSGRRVIYDG
jgi:hypothetical protein